MSQKLSKAEIAELDPFADVKLVPLKRSDQDNVVSRNAVVYDSEGTNLEVGFVSSDYRLIPNRVAHDVALDIISRSGMKFQERQTFFNGRQYRQRWTFPELSVEPVKGQFCEIGVDTLNSYDGSMLYEFNFIAYVCECTNGMMIDHILGNFRFRHLQPGNGHKEIQEIAGSTISITDEWLRELDKAAESIHNLQGAPDKILPTLENMAKKKVSLAEFADISRTVDPKASITAKALQVMESDTAWGVYNGFTKILSDENTLRADRRNREISQHFFERFKPLKKKK